MIISVTGHRPNKLMAHGKPAYPGTFSYDRLVSLSMKALSSYQPDKVISGMALGFDMAIAQAAVHLDIPFVAAIPFKGQESKWPKPSQDYYWALLDHANEIEYVNEEGYAAWKMQRRNEWMVDHADAVIAMWNGTSGGTENCVKYAKERCKNVINFWDVWERHKESIPFSIWEPSPINYYGIVFPSLANFMKAIEYTDERIRRHISTLQPQVVMSFSQHKERRRDNLNNIYYDAVLYGVREKYRQNTDLAKTLIASYPKQLYHWAKEQDFELRRDVNIDTEEGQNMMGQLLEVVRDELRQ